MEKRNFITQWEQNVKSAWNYKIIKILSGGLNVVLDLKFKTQIEGIWLHDHWELSVMKAQKFARSYVNTFSGNSQLDTQDLIVTPKNFGLGQRGAVHEFGHMLGLPDEYEKQSAWYADKNSIMNNGEVVKGRHLSEFRSWIDKKLQKHAIK
ncbi:immune inhibitor A domain-containing protein [Niabella hibiscisoli]|uniref:immune inhibitor A domain-containing protein n=1 Tax=Niabella hibiscisoli TaxID=1825928 RepID=UPI001F0FF58A|nr:immune inhibitor A domain-containing protein [Niabella hibiscisoli]MCH5721028.1 immune inhibitor A [Niabella hibiscisoli]